MATPTFNPYPQIGTELIAGMDSIASALTPASTVDDLVNAIYSYIQPIYYPLPTVPKQIEIEIKSVAYHIINAYNNKALWTSMKFSSQQMNFICMMLGGITDYKTPINAINSWLLDNEDNITKANLSIDDQVPLLLGIQEGKSIYKYWITKTAAPGTWAPFFETAESHNYANVPHWLVACMEGGLIGSNTSPNGLISPTIDIVSVDIISSLIGALAIGAGKVIFKWVPRIQPYQIVSAGVNYQGGCSCGQMQPNSVRTINFTGAGA
ncbi:MAG TPA: hypothetical protein VNZ49_07315 [Bacteroidia bacterium]|jgi:hypothetical protein|nr:hypothetical protein [Bacteroidia bacterium]